MCGEAWIRRHVAPGSYCKRVSRYYGAPSKSPKEELEFESYVQLTPMLLKLTGYEPLQYIRY